MHDPNMRNFYGRIGRIEETHRRGGGFEAEGTLGMEHFRPRARRSRLGWVMPVALVLMTIVAIKAAVLVHLGPDAYAARVQALSTGSVSDRIGAYVLQADPLTEQLALFIERMNA